MEKFITGGLYDETINRVVIERETNNFVWIEGKRLRKDSNFKQFHDTWDEAHSYLIGLAKDACESANRNLELSQKKLFCIRGIKKPEDVL